MKAIDQEHVSKSPARLHLAFELGWGQWKLAFTTGHGQPPRLRTILARDLAALLHEIARAKQRFGLPADADVVSCYEAGRDGFWLHRWLTSQGIANVIVDSASIEVNRRRRRAKSDHLDAAKLVSMLLRYHAGEHKVWSVVKVPTAADEDQRQLHRELIAVQDERTEHINRIKALLAGQGIALAQVTANFPEMLATLRCWDASALGADVRQRLLREFARWQLADQHVHELEDERRQRIRCNETPHVHQVRCLLELAGVGLCGSWLLVYELFGWRRFTNRRQVGAIVGLTPTPYQSGARDQQGGQQAGASSDGGAGLGLVTLAAGQRLDALVSAPLRRPGPACPQGRRGRPGTQAVDLPVASVGDRRNSARRSVGGLAAQGEPQEGRRRP